MASTIEIETPLHRPEISRTGRQDLAQKALLFGVFLLCAIAVFVFGSNYYSIFPTNKNLWYEGGTTAFFLAAAFLLRRWPRTRPYWQVAYAFFVAAAVIFVTSITVDIRDALLNGIGISGRGNQALAAGKVIEALVTIGTVLLLSRLAGFNLESIYVKRGNLKWGLLLGLGVLVNFMTSSLMFFSARFTSLDVLGSVILYGLIFSLANGFLEEIWLRAQFMRKLEPLLGAGVSIVLTATWWSLFHVGSVYMTPQAIPFYLANLLTFGLAYGYVMRKTDSWIGPGLMHAAADFFLFVAMLSSG
jgi:membrane protease YdiL (CAAX protease family)